MTKDAAGTLLPEGKILETMGLSSARRFTKFKCSNNSRI
jgi:hypothetical protein